MCRLCGFLGGAAKVKHHLCSTRGHSAWAIKQSEMAATCAWLGDSQAKLRCESRLTAASAGSGSLSRDMRASSLLRPAVDCLIEFRKL